MDPEESAKYRCLTCGLVFYWPAQAKRFCCKGCQERFSYKSPYLARLQETRNTLELQAQIRKYKQGQSIVEIANEYKISKNTLYKRFDKAGVARRPQKFAHILAMRVRRLNKEIARLKEYTNA